MAKEPAVKVIRSVTGLKEAAGFRPVVSMTASPAPNNRVKRLSPTVETPTTGRNSARKTVTREHAKSAKKIQILTAEARPKMSPKRRKERRNDQ